MTGLLARFESGDRNALARILTHVENQTPLGTSALQSLTPMAGNAHLVGLTGPPGAGKSTLVNALIGELRRRGRTVAVVAIDPSSPLSGGAALGDRVRMLEMQDDPCVFIRSMASRGQIGGLAVSAFGAATTLDAFGFDVVLIETVGAGQDEVDIASLADTVVLLQTPGAGDSIQVTKAGILEIADLLVVNKADLEGADDLARDLRQMVRSGDQREWSIPVISTVAASAKGIDAVVDKIDEHHAHLTDSDQLENRRTRRLRHHARMLAMSWFAEWLDERLGSVYEASGDPVELAERLMAEYKRERVDSDEQT